MTNPSNDQQLLIYRAQIWKEIKVKYEIAIDESKVK